MNVVFEEILIIITFTIVYTQFIQRDIYVYVYNIMKLIDNIYYERINQYLSI